MKIATAFSTHPDLATALQEAMEALQQQLGKQPDLTLLYYTEQIDPHALSTTLTKQSAGALHGCSSCLGLMTASGFHSNDGRALGLWGAHDPEGAYGSALVEMNEQPRRAGAGGNIEEAQPIITVHHFNRGTGIKRPANWAQSSVAAMLKLKRQRMQWPTCQRHLTVTPSIRWRNFR